MRQRASCGPDSQRPVVVQARSAQEAAAARLELGDAITTYERNGGDRHEYVMAKLALADDALERYLELAFPTGLDFDPDPARKAVNEESVKRFSAWVNAKSELGSQLRDRYKAIAALGDPVGAVLATSRMGTIAASFANALYTAEIPVDVRTGEHADDKVDAYCDMMTTVAEPLEAQAIEAFTACATLARDHTHGANARERQDIIGAAEPCLDAMVRSGSRVE